MHARVAASEVILTIDTNLNPNPNPNPYPNILRRVGAAQRACVDLFGEECVQIRVGVKVRVRVRVRVREG